MAAAEDFLASYKSDANSAVCLKLGELQAQEPYNLRSSFYQEFRLID